MSEFTAKIATVTDATSGIGRMRALFYAREGANMVVPDIDEEGGQKTVRLICEAAGKTIFIKTEVANPLDCEVLIKRTIGNDGRLDFACNNAGMEGEQGRTADYSIERWQKVIAINLSGVFYCMKYEIGEMLKVGEGAIVCMASILRQVGFFSASAYTAAKHGVVGLTRTAAIECTAKGIRINSIGSAFIRTPLITSLEENAKVLDKWIAFTRWAVWEGLRKFSNWSSG